MSVVKGLAAFQYRFVRVPIAIADFKLVQRLPKGSLPRVVIQRTVLAADQLAALVLGDQSLARISTEGFVAAHDSTPDEHEAASEATPDEPIVDEPADITTEPEVIAAAEDRAKATKAQQHTVARSNKSLASIRQGLLQTEAVAEVREHRAEDAAHSPEVAEPTP